MSVRDATNAVTSYTYDVTDQLTGATLPGGTTPVRTWSYGWHGQLTSETQPESGTTQYVYDYSGNLFHTVDSLGQQVFRLYDSDNRPYFVDYGATAANVSLTYDPLGRLQTQSIPGTFLALNYDTSGRLEYRTDVVSGQYFESRYTYDLNDNLETITYPSGRVVTYVYDENRLVTVKQNNVIFADLFAYDDAGRLKSYRTGGVTQTIKYDAAQRIERLTAGSLLDLTYGYDDVGNVRSITDPRPGASQAFTPDALNRLTAGSGPWGQLSWGYDAAGNRLWERSPAQTTYTYNTATQRLTSTSGASVDTFGYDNLGRLTSDSRGTYNYKVSGLLGGVTAPGVTASYEYDAIGLRMRRTVNGQTSYTIRSAGGDILSEYAVPCGGAMVWTKDTIYAAGRPLGALKATVAQPSIEFESAGVSSSEGQTSVSLSARLTTPASQPLSCAATVGYETKSLTAKEGLDFTRTAGVLTFPPGSANGATTSMSVALTPDALDESDEAFQVRLSTATGAVVGATMVTTVTVLDDDATPALTVGDVMVTEGQSGLSDAVFTVSLSAVSGQDVQVTYATAPNTATAPSDYAFVAGVLTIPEGAASATIAVPVQGDLAREATERFVITLTQPVNAVIGDGSAIGTIVNDDAGGSVLHDFDGDGKADIVVFRPTDPSGGLWLLRYSSGAPSSGVQWGGLGDIPVAADYDGDGQADIAVFRQSDANGGTWYVRPSVGAPSTTQWGGYGDVPVPADYDGDGQADIAVYRPSEANWYVRFSTGTTLIKPWGSWGDIPMPADFDGDGKSDVAVYRPSTGVWYIWQSTTDSPTGVVFGGSPSDVPVVADYDGDGVADFGVYKPNEGLGGTWDVRYSSTGTIVTMQWGVSADLLVPADFDGDGAADLAVFRPSNATWYVWLSGSESAAGVPWGSWGDIPALMRPKNPNY